VRPDDTPIEHRIQANDIELACFEWNPNARGRGPTFVMAHATGFHARCWDEIIRRFGDRHVLSVDLRGHGRSTSVEIEHWKNFGEDLVALIEALEIDSVLGVGHSMGAHAMVDAAAHAPERFCGLYLFDPVIGDPKTYGGDRAGHFAGFADGGHPIARRRAHFDSLAEMIERFENRPPYCHFDPAVFRAYCEYGLLPAEKGGYELACPPKVEASVYMTSRSNTGIFESARSFESPVLIVRAQLPPAHQETFDFSVSPTWPGLVDEFPDAREIHFPEASHFMPFEDPTAIAAQILEHCDIVLGASIDSGR